MRYYVIAGEASGDLYGAKLLEGLKSEDAQADFRIWGGDLMEAQGVTLIKHYRDLAFMGFVEVAKNIRTIRRNMQFCKADILQYQADVLILIDYPGFNLRIADWAKKQDIRVFYYISPTVWAWHRSRIKQIKQSVERLFVIFPFEPEFFQEHDYAVDYAGHPLLDVVNDFEKNLDFRAENGLSDLPIIALLPGSRVQEIKRMLGVMLQMLPRFPEHQFVIAAAPAMDKVLYEEILQESGFPLSERLHLVYNQTYDILSEARAALVTSGTATVETALFNVPQVVCYKTNFLTYQIARRLVDLSHIGMVNIIAKKTVAEELIQHELNPERLETELGRILEAAHRQRIHSDYAAIRTQLGEAGVAKRVAALMYAYLND